MIVPKWKLLASAAVALALLLSPHAAQACKCKVRDRSPPVILASAEVLFNGVVISERAGNETPIAITTFKVVDGFKGVKAGEKVDVSHRKGRSASCGVTFEVGRSYVVNAFGKNPNLATSRCSMLGLLGADEQLIGEFKKLSQK